MDRGKDIFVERLDRLQDINGEHRALSRHFPLLSEIKLTDGKGRKPGRIALRFFECAAHSGRACLRAKTRKGARTGRPSF